MNDVLDMLRADRSRDEVKREQIRADFPLCTSIIDDFRAVFGPCVKPKFFSESGKTMGKEQPFDGTDADKIIRLGDAKRRWK